MTSYACFLLLSLTPACCFLLGVWFAHKFLLQEVHVLEEETAAPELGEAHSRAKPPEPTAWCFSEAMWEEWEEGWVESYPRVAA